MRTIDGPGVEDSLLHPDERVTGTSPRVAPTGELTIVTDGQDDTVFCPFDVYGNAAGTARVGDRLLRHSVEGDLHRRQEVAELTGEASAGLRHDVDSNSTVGSCTSARRTRDTEGNRETGANSGCSPVSCMASLRILKYVICAQS